MKHAYVFDSNGYLILSAKKANDKPDFSGRYMRQKLFRLNLLEENCVVFLNASQPLIDAINTIRRTGGIPRWNGTRPVSIAPEEHETAMLTYSSRFYPNGAKNGG